MKPTSKRSEQTPQGRATQRGFTLVEMLMAMAVSAILLAIAVPQMSSFSAARAVRSQISSLATTMRLARTEAVKRGMAVTVCATSTPNVAAPACDAGNAWETGWVMFTDRGANRAMDAGDQVIRVEPALETTGGVTSSGGAVTYFSNGIAIGGQRRYVFLPAGASMSNPTPDALAMCQSAVGSARVVKFSEPC